MPYFDWKKEDTKYSLCFFPAVGIVIGLITSSWMLFADRFGINVFAYTLVAAAVSLIITGGFHVDGFMDTMDALKSYKDRDEKLKILSDPHIGAFSVIMVILYYMLYLSAISTIRDSGSIIVLGFTFPLSRAMSGLSLLYFRPAKKCGSLEMTREAADKKTVSVFLFGMMILLLGISFFISHGAAAGMAVGACISIYYYRYISYKEFGGITGDIAGFFVCVAELFMAVGITVSETLTALL